MSITSEVNHDSPYHAYGIKIKNKRSTNLEVQIVLCKELTCYHANDWTVIPAIHFHKMWPCSWQRVELLQAFRIEWRGVFKLLVNFEMHCMIPKLLPRTLQVQRCMPYTWLASRLPDYSRHISIINRFNNLSGQFWEKSTKWPQLIDLEDYKITLNNILICCTSVTRRTILFL